MKRKLDASPSIIYCPFTLKKKKGGREEGRVRKRLLLKKLVAFQAPSTQPALAVQIHRMINFDG